MLQTGSLSPIMKKTREVGFKFVFQMIVHSRGTEALAHPSQRGQSVTTVLSGRHLPIRKLYRAPFHNSLIFLMHLYFFYHDD